MTMFKWRSALLLLDPEHQVSPGIPVMLVRPQALSVDEKCFSSRA